MSYTLAYTGAEIDALLGKIDAIFVAEYGSTIYSEVTAAIAADNKVIVANAGKVYVYAGQDDNGGYVFTQSGPNAAKPNATYVTLSTGNVWSTATVDLATLQQFYASLMEDTASGSIASFPDGAEGVPVKELTADIEPIQDLHGYDNPWPAGGGKNKLPKGVSVSGSGLTFAVQDDGKVLVTGTATATAFWAIAFTLPAGSYILTGCPSGGGNNNYSVDVRNAPAGSGIPGIPADAGNGASFTLSEELTAYVNIRIQGGYACPSGGLLFPLMIRLSTEADATFAPYSNICPISGYTGAEITVAGKNLFDGEYLVGHLENGNTWRNNLSNARTAAVPIKGGVTYTIKKYGGNRFAICEAPTLPVVGTAYTNLFNDNTASQATVTPSASANYLLIYATLDNTEPQMQVEVGTTASPYEAYNGQTYSISWSDEAGTVYKGYLVVNSEGSKKLIATHKYLLADGVNVKTASMGTYGATGVHFGRISLSGALGKLSGGATRIISNCLVDTDPVEPRIGDCYIVTNGDMLIFAIPDQTITTTAAMDTWLASNNIQFVYELATPIEYDLADVQQIKTLLGDNNIWSNTGDISVKYRANTALYIEKKLGE